MKKELKNAFGRVFLTIEADTRNRWVHVNWMGYLTADNIKTGAGAYIEVMQQAEFNCVLNDTRLILGTWDHSLDWVIYEWAPKAAAAGLKHFAMITTPESFGDSSAAKFHKELKAFEAALFDNRPEAETWLKGKALSNK
ncbi:STAS/SEC14 domain-containing protein [uncultured Pontibacter sp.]|uniref:STAS/SEC14 domain-containing protein n=1 Tax=uncultured Pontibacter sp. TaxID=453356 RepID=UPI00261FF63E|nr:STAS/SEC14 domain-containing protein [uncultured Pontibacter sp.]